MKKILIVLLLILSGCANITNPHLKEQNYISDRVLIDEGYCAFYIQLDKHGRLYAEFIKELSDKECPLLIGN